MSWNTTTAANGSHTLTAVARDAAGNTTTSTAVSVTVTVDNTAPTVSVTAPAGGATVSGTVTLSATASDNVGVAGVQFLVDGTPLGAEDTASPYSVSWDTTTATNGTHTLTAQARDAAGNIATSSTVTVTVANLLPRHQTIISADPNNGEVHGSISPSGPGFSYTVISPPALGTATVNASGSYTYNPTQAARLAADQTTGPDTDTFTVRVSNGQSSTDVAVSVPVAPARLTVVDAFSPTLGNTPVGFDLNYRRAWVLNQADGTLSIIEVPHGYPVGTFAVGTSPRSISFDDGYAWVTNQGSNTVSVVDLVYTPGTTVTLEGFNQPWDVMTDYPGIQFVSNYGNGTVVAIHPQTKQVLRTFQVGQGPTEMAFDGGHIYVANSGSNSVSMINIGADTVSATIPVGDTPMGIAVNLNGTRVYVANQGSNTVSVINTATNTVIGPPISVGPQPYSLTLTYDNSLVYVANSDDTVSVIDTRTNTVVRTVTIDPNPESGLHFVAMSNEQAYPPRSPAGARVYVTDAADRTMRAIAIVPSPPPQVPATATPISVANPIDIAAIGDGINVPFRVPFRATSPPATRTHSPTACR